MLFGMKDLHIFKNLSKIHFLVKINWKWIVPHLNIYVPVLVCVCASISSQTSEMSVWLIKNLNEP